MRISDWSSDVCSSDLNQGDGADDERSDIEHGRGSRTPPPMRQEPFGSSMDALVSSCCLGFMQRDREPARFLPEAPDLAKGRNCGTRKGLIKIGRASCRERVCQYV